MSGSQGLQRGTVADRIRAFQDIQALEAARKPNPGTRALSQANESGILSGRGRRQDASFAPPASRAARDGNEGFRGDGRPPVASIVFRKPLAAVANAEQKQHPETMPVRPVTSLEQPSNEQAKFRRPTETNELPSLHRRYRSMENVGDPAQEIAAARSRLRSVVDKIMERESPSQERADTLAELGHMLDDAIEHQSSNPGVISAELSDEATPRPELPSQSQTRQTSRHQSHSRGPKSTRSTDSAMPRSSDDSARVHYADELQSQPRSPANEKAPVENLDPEASSVETLSGTLYERQPSRPVLELCREPFPLADQKLSPVKQRAAMFESLVQKPSQHDQACQHFSNAKDPVQGESHKSKDTRKYARIKFGDTIEERPATPLIPLSLPAMVGTGLSCQTTPPEQPAPEAMVYGGEKPAEDSSHQRKSSMGWPFKWSIFNKSPTAPPQEAETAPAGDEARYEDQPSSKPSSKPSTVKSIVHDLLQAANEKDDAEKRRRHSERERLSRRQSRAPSIVKETELREDKVKLEELKPANVPPLQLPIEEEVEGLASASTANETLSEPRTPLQRAMTEKQVLSPTDRLESLNESNPSPRKSDPRTPVRGRSRKSIHRLSVGDQRGVEHRFNLSPGSSRSRSRNGRAGVKVEVEVRDSPEREARDKGEKILIIRANVEPVESDE